MRKLLIATKNKGKIRELTKFLSDLPFEIVTLRDISISDDVEEDGKTYTENSQKKARFYAKKSNLPALADDGGLEIAALRGAPGVRSRRWLGYEATDEELITHLQEVARTLPDENRQAVFKTVVSFALPDGAVWSVPGEITGVIAKKPHMKLLQGYPYRSFFFLPKIQKYYHEDTLSPEELLQYNHRYKAVQQIKHIILRELHGIDKG